MKREKNKYKEPLLARDNTKCLAVEWAQHNITVNAVAPTFINTPGTAWALGDEVFRADYYRESHWDASANPWKLQAQLCSSLHLRHPLLPETRS
jgi:NAD(P)-dependent dehydrogenase (short-subunit alcohol dehydrogenase family)